MTDPELSSEIAQLATNVVRAMLPDIIKEITATVMGVSMRPAVIQSDSGVSSVTREKMANGTCKITTHVYHEDPEMADVLSERIYQRAIEWADNHEPGANYEEFVKARG